MTGPISISVDTAQLDAALLRKASLLHDPSAMLEEIGILAERSVKQNFKAGGRPEKWKPSARARAQGGQTLVDTNNLQRSITHQISGGEVAIGTNVLYAPVHHFGTVIRAKGAKSLRFEIPGVGWRTAKSVTIPARPFLLLQAQDYKRINSIIRKHVESA